MSFVLIYTEGGLEKSSEPMFSLDLINQHIRDLYDAEDANAPITVLAVQEDRDDAPRTWAIEYPSAPPAGTRVATKGGMVLTVGEGGRVQMSAGANYSWKGLLEELGELTEVVETELEAAARRLREFRFDSSRWMHDDVRTVLKHVLNGGQL